MGGIFYSLVKNLQSQGLLQVLYWAKSFHLIINQLLSEDWPVMRNALNLLLWNALLLLKQCLCGWYFLTVDIYPGRVFNKGAFVHTIQKLNFLHLITKLFHKDSSSLSRINFSLWRSAFFGIRVSAIKVLRSSRLHTNHAIHFTHSTRWPAVGKSKCKKFCLIRRFGFWNDIWSQSEHSVSCMTILSLNLQTTRSDIRPHMKYDANLVIALYSSILPLGFVWVCLS